jgi:hypothetical protein
MKKEQVELESNTLRLAHSVLQTHLKVDPVVRANPKLKAEFTRAVEDLRLARHELDNVSVPL